jgi:fatty acid desaturase
MHKTIVHKQDIDMRAHIDQSLLKAMATPAPFRLLLQTAIEWLWIVALIVAAVWCSNIAFSLVCMLLIATRQHALLALMHEYSHYQLSRRHAWLNDLIADIFTALPFFITVHGFRRNHMLHHRYGATDQDHNWLASLKKDRYQFPKTRKQIFIEILKHCLGRYTLDDLKGYTVDAGMSVNLPRAARINAAIFTIIIAAAITYFKWWSIVLQYWIVPLATFLAAILYLRDMGEHFGMPSPGIYNARTVVAGWIERILICPHGVNFHTEHHICPAVPFFRLKQLHDVLLKNNHYRDNAVITHGYMSGLIDEVSAVPRDAVSV